MIDFVEGKVEDVGKDSIILNVNGIGLCIITSRSTFETVKVGEKLRIYTSLLFNVNASSFEIYGFESREKRDLFEKLKTVSKIGPKTALKVVSSIDLPDFINMVFTEDADSLSKLSGIGKKSAERIVLELKNKFGAEVDISKTKKSIFSDAVEALVNLGYPLKTASFAVREVLKNDKYNGTYDLSQVIKESLKVLLSEVKKR